MKVQVNEATPTQLNWLVAKCEGVSWSMWLLNGYATDWAQGGPIIERECINLRCYTDALWDASIGRLDYVSDGPTPLIAAMRCYVSFKLGEECDIPDELITGE